LEGDAIVVPSPILGEVDYLLRVRLGQAAGIRFLEGVEKGVFTVEPFTVADASSCRNLLERYSELDLGLADASVIVIAERLGLRRILTVDQCDFRAVRDSRGAPFVLLPADKQR
jgi:predicted nucleic acid-binding protein